MLWYDDAGGCPHPTSRGFDFLFLISQVPIETTREREEAGGSLEKEMSCGESG